MLGPEREAERDFERADPREFARRYETALRAHMTEMSLKSRQARERRATLAVLMHACPVCNAELGLTIPSGTLVESCRKHWIEANRAGFNAVLDEAEARIAV